jgi:hypothetical protein
MHLFTHYACFPGKEYVIQLKFTDKGVPNCQRLSTGKALYDRLALLVRDKDADDDLFGLIDYDSLNRGFKGLRPDLTAKVFRTLKASDTMEMLLATCTQVA